MKRFKPVAYTCAASLGLYLAAFVWQFQLLGLPVRNNDHGWLGPPLRRNPNVRDIGKIYYYEGTDYSSYHRFYPLCQVWLWMNGFGP